MRKRVVQDNALYSTDNGRIVCGRHCGTSAACTGRDISGQRIARVTPAFATRWYAMLGEPVHCEVCGTFDHPLRADASTDPL